MEKRSHVQLSSADRRKEGGFAGSWELMMHKGGVQKMLNEYCTVLNQYLDHEYKLLNVNEYIL